MRLLPTSRQRSGRRLPAPLHRWIFGRDEYVSPILRWAATPLFQLVTGVFLVFLLLDKSPPAGTTGRIVALALLGVSVAAEIVNALILRARRAR